MGGLAAFSATMVRNPALPLFIASLGVDEGTLGIIAAASSAVGVVAGLPAGMLSDVWGRRRVILVSLSIFAVTPFLYLLVTTPEQLVLVRICHGLGSAILGPAAFAAVADTYRAGRGERMAWYSSASQVGRFVAPSVGGLLIVGSDFTRVFVGCGFAGLLALLAFVAWRSSAGAGPELAAIGRSRASRSVCQAARGGAAGGLQRWHPAHQPHGDRPSTSPTARWRPSSPCICSPPATPRPGDRPALHRSGHGHGTVQAGAGPPVGPAGAPPVHRRRPGFWAPWW